MRRDFFVGRRPCFPVKNRVCGMHSLRKTQKFLLPFKAVIARPGTMPTAAATSRIVPGHSRFPQIPAWRYPCPPPCDLPAVLKFSRLGRHRNISFSGTIIVHERAKSMNNVCSKNKKCVCHCSTMNGRVLRPMSGSTWAIAAGKP